MTTILIVDDSRMSRRVLRKILEPTGYRIIEAEDGLSGLERFYLDKPDLVMLDLTMKGMHGLEVLQKLREIDNRVQIVVATADIQDMTRDQAIEQGANGFIAKPFSEEAVLETIKNLLREANDAANRNTA